MSHWSLCRLENGGLTRLQGDCPQGAQTLKPYEPQKDCSQKAAQQQAQQQNLKFRNGNESQVPNPIAPLAGYGQTKTDMAKIPWTQYIPFFATLAIFVLVAILYMRSKVSAGTSWKFILLKGSVSLLTAVALGWSCASWGFLLVLKKIGNTDGAAAGVLGLLIGVLIFAICGSIGGFLGAKTVDLFMKKVIKKTL